MNKSQFMVLPGIALALFLIFSSGCVMAPVVPPIGGIYTNIMAPIDIESGTGKQIGSKTGEASTVAILGMVAFGDAGLNAAARNGGITRIYHVDYRFLNVFLGTYCKFTTVVYGE